MGIDIVTLALAKEYANKKIHNAELGNMELDKTLTKENYAADAKATGDAIGAVRSLIENVDIGLAEEDAFTLAVEMDLIDPVVNENGAIFIDENNRMIII